MTTERQMRSVLLTSIDNFIDDLRSNPGYNEWTSCMTAERSTAASHQHSTAIEHAQPEIIDTPVRRPVRPNTDLTLSATLPLTAACRDVARCRWIGNDFEGDFKSCFSATLDADRLGLGPAPGPAPAGTA